jgi:hypothetical protein
MGNPHLLPCGPEVNAAFPVQPVSAALHSPQAPRRGLIQLSNQFEQPVLGGIHVAAQRGDLIAEGIEVVHGATSTVHMYSIVVIRQRKTIANGLHEGHLQ